MTDTQTELTVKQRAFLAAFAATGNITQAAKAAKQDRCQHYDWSKKSEVYTAAFAAAKEEAAETLEAEARRRAVDGVEEPVFYKGGQCGAVRRYSDVLLIFLLKGVLPEKYRERQQVEVSGSLGNLTEEQLVERERRLGLPVGPIDTSDLEGG